jgi:hypothetical protein
MNTPLINDAQRRCQAAAAIEQQVRDLAHRYGVHVSDMRWKGSVHSGCSGAYCLCVDTQYETAKIYFIDHELNTYVDTPTRHEVNDRLENVITDLRDQPQVPSFALPLDRVGEPKR